MDDSFQRGRLSSTSMADQAQPPKKKVRAGTPVYLGMSKPEEENATESSPSSLALALRALRGFRGLSLAQLARNSTIKRQLLARYEAGQTVPRPETQERIVSALEVTSGEMQSLADLFEGAPELKTLAMGWPRGGEDRLRYLVRRLRLAGLLQRLHHFVPTSIASSAPSGLEARYPADPEADWWKALALRMRLEGYSSAQRRSIILELTEFHCWALSSLLCDESVDSAPKSGSAALELAELADLIAQQVAGSRKWVSRLRGYTGAHVASALRVLGRLRDSELSFGRAEALWASGDRCDPDDLLDEARVLGLHSSLLREQNRLTEALDLLNRALALQSPTETKFLLLNVANVYAFMGDYEKAIEALVQMEPLLEREQEPQFVWAQRFNLIANLCRLERYHEAEQRLPELRSLSTQDPESLLNIRFGWLEGWIAAGQGRLEEAEVALGRVREEFLARDILFDAARASLALVTLYLKQGRTAEVKRIALDVVKVFQAQGVAREALAAAKLFRDAAFQERATVDLTRRLVDFLRRAQHEPGLRFRG